MLKGKVGYSLSGVSFQKCVSQLQGGLRGQRGGNCTGEEKDTALEGQGGRAVLLEDNKISALPCERQCALYHGGGQRAGPQTLFHWGKMSV